MEELGIILVSIIAIFVILGVLFALAYLFRKSEKVIKKIEELKAKLMWSSVLRSAMQGYFISTFSQLNNWNKRKFNTDKNAIQVYFSIALAFAFPVLVTVILVKNK